MGVARQIDVQPTAIVHFSESSDYGRKVDFAVAEGEVARSLVEIYRSLGGGWQIRLGQLPPMAAAPLQPGDIEELPPVEPPAAIRDEEPAAAPELGG